MIIPVGTTGFLTFENDKFHLVCDRIIKSQGTAFLTIRRDYVEHCMIILDREAPETSVKPKRSHKKSSIAAVA